MAEKLFYSMGEVAEMFDVNASLIRHWESQFTALRPKRNKKGNRMFTPADVENLKIIYHLVKERGMTLDGAKKALKQVKNDGSTSRKMELLERLQRVRAMLVEVKEDLDANQGEIVETTVSTGRKNETPKPNKGAKAVIKIEEQSDKTEETEETSPIAVRKPRKKKDDDSDKELFAFYEQRLF